MLVWSTTILSNFSTPGSGMVYYHSIQLFNTKVNGWNFWKLTSSRYVAKKRGEHFRFAPLARPPSPHLIRFVLVGNDVAVNVVLLLEELGVACLQLFRMRRVMPNKVTLHMPQRQRTRSRQGHAKKKEACSVSKSRGSYVRRGETKP